MREPAPFSPLESRPAAERHAVLTAVLDTTPDAIVVCDAAMRVVWLNAAAEQLLGHPADRMRGNQVQMLVPERNRQAHRSLMAAFLNGEARRGQLDPQLLIPVVHAAGHEVPVDALLSKIALEDEVLISIVLRDLRESIRTDQVERERVQLQTRLEHLAVSAPGTIFSVEVDATGTPHFTWVSPRVAILTGRSPAAFVGDPALAFSFVHPDDAARVLGSIGQAAREGRDWKCEFRGGRADPGWMWLEGRAAVDPPARNGRLTYHGFFIDISDRKLAEEAREASEGFARATLDALSAHIAVVDGCGQIIAVNHSWREFARRQGGRRLQGCDADRNYLEVADAVATEHASGISLAQGLRDVLSGRIERFDQEYPCQTDEGQRLFMARVTPFTARGERMAVVAHEEVTAQRRVERSLREVTRTLRRAERNVQMALAAAELGTWHEDLAVTPRLFTADARARVHFDLDSATVPSETVASRLHPLDADRVRQAVEQAIGALGPTTFSIEYRVADRAGRERWLAVHAQVQFDGEGEARHAVSASGTSQDITDRKRAQEAVQKSESDMRLALDAAQLGSWRHELASGMMTFDERGRRHAGVASTVAPFEEAMARLHPADVGVLRAAMAGALDPDGTGIAAHEHRVLTEAGAERWLAVHARTNFEGDGPDRRAMSIHGTTQDITARKLAEQALQQSERSFRQMAETVGQVFWMASGAAREVHYVSPAFQHVWGRTSATLYRNPDVWIQSVLPADRARVLQAFEALATDGHYDVEFRIVRPDGAVRWINDRGYRQRDDDASVRLSSGVATDVTDRREAEEAVKRFVSGSPAIIYAWQAGPAYLRHVWTSSNVETFTGHRAPASQEALWWMAHVHAEDRERVQAAHLVPYEIDHQLLEFRFTRADGQTIWIRDEKRLFRDDRGRAAEVIGSWTDVTSRIELEEQLRQAQKMEAVGRLAGGIAHDFNNLLTVICGSSELVLMDTADDDPVHALVSEIQRAGQRAVSLTRQLLAFSRKQVLDLKVVDLNGIVTTVETMLRRVIGEDVALVTRVATAPVLVQTDPGQMEQVLVNLAVNARDAMPRGGRLTIETGTFVMTPEFCHARPGSRPGLYASLLVRDTGTGMTPEVRARLFEPFFTTKGPGKGTGLGLAMVFGIVKQSEGYVEVKTELGQGSSFTIYLPAVTAPATPPPPPERALAPPRGHETILLVEDETAVRKLTRRALESFGYHVLEASGGPAALEMAAAHPTGMALLVTDVVMPQMSGPEVAEALAKTHPDVRVLFVSGYIDDAIVRHGVVEGAHSFLQKPFLPATLATKVREILDRR
jgi:two-component system, cell cycle sensor histidine kinase and response regulator CckA